MQLGGRSDEQVPIREIGSLSVYREQAEASLEMVLRGVE